jgi:hypothetical protein
MGTAGIAAVPTRVFDRFEDPHIRVNAGDGEARRSGSHWPQTSGKEAVVKLPQCDWAYVPP